jgi:aspartyl-tRNA(Asn)/glutamyl-tRNA(Gln) amidotransferase subunit C
MASHISQDQILHVAQLAQIPISSDEAQKFTSSFEETLVVIDNLKSVDTSNTEPTHQVTGLENVLREDIVDEKHMFTQKEALANAPKQHQGFFMVDRILHND